MKKLMQIRKLRFIPLRRRARTRLEPGDRLEVVRVRPSRTFRGKRLPERVTIQVAKLIPESGSEFDVLASERGERG